MKDIGDAVQHLRDRDAALDRLDALAAKMTAHAAKCRRCTQPIIDEEGNPGCRDEACPAGARMLDRYGKMFYAAFGE